MLRCKDPVELTPEDDRIESELRHLFTALLRTAKPPPGPEPTAPAPELAVPAPEAALPLLFQESLFRIPALSPRSCCFLMSSMAPAV